MHTNGNINIDVDEGGRLRSLLQGAHSVDDVIPVLAKAADAILIAGQALKAMARDLDKIGSDTARAISDTVEMKRHLKAITDREQVLRRELDAVKLASASAQGLRRELDAVKLQLSAVGKRGKAKKKRRRHG